MSTATEICQDTDREIRIGQGSCFHPYAIAKIGSWVYYPHGMRSGEYQIIGVTKSRDGRDLIVLRNEDSGQTLKSWPGVLDLLNDTPPPQVACASQFTPEQIEDRIRATRQLLAQTSDPSTLATLSRCLERLLFM
jgi:hypothetical protein